MNIDLYYSPLYYHWCLVLYAIQWYICSSLSILGQIQGYLTFLFLKKVSGWSFCFIMCRKQVLVVRVESLELHQLGLYMENHQVKGMGHVLVYHSLCQINQNRSRGDPYYILSHSLSWIKNKFKGTLTYSQGVFLHNRIYDCIEEGSSDSYLDLEITLSL